MRETITVNVGSAGANMAYNIWKKLSEEHFVDSNGESYGTLNYIQNSLYYKFMRIIMLFR